MDVSTIVVGYDGSDCSQRALDAALSIINEDGTIHLVSAYDAPSARKVKDAYASVPAELTSAIDLMSGPRGTLERAAKAATDKGYAVVEHFIDDDPASAILDIATEVEADLLVVGSRGLGRATRAIRGSVSTKIAHHAHVDFMIVH